jgi:hypothetical protein
MNEVHGSQLATSREEWHPLPSAWWNRLKGLVRANCNATLETFFAERTEASEKHIRRSISSNRITVDSLRKLAVGLGYDNDWKKVLTLLGGTPPETSITTHLADSTGNAHEETTANASAITDTLECICSSSGFHLRDIANQDELYRLWQIDCAAYDDRSITFAQFLSQWQAFPHFPKALFRHEDIAAAIGIMPTTEERMTQFRDRHIQEADLQNDNLGQFMSGGVNVWLIDGIVRNPKYPKSATRELVCSSILSWIHDGLIRYPVTIYAIGQNRAGMNLITRAGFTLLKPAEALPDGLPFYRMTCNSELDLLKLLVVRLRSYADPDS